MSLRPVSLALALALGAGSTAFAAPAPAPAVAVAHGSPAHVASPRAVADARYYADVEARDQKPAEFHGGSVIYIGLSAGALLAAFLLLILLV